MRNENKIFAWLAYGNIARPSMKKLDSNSHMALLMDAIFIATAALAINNIIKS